MEAIADLASLHEIVRRIDLPLVFLAADGGIVDRNPAAAAALADAHPWLYELGGRLWVAGASGLQAVAASLQTLGTNVDVQDLVNDQRRVATLELIPVQRSATDSFAERRALAIAILRRGARNKVQALRKVHGLTEAEARVAVQLAEGRSAAQVAEAMAVSISTIRTHIAAAMAKLDVDRQARLVALVLGL